MTPASDTPMSTPSLAPYGIAPKATRTAKVFALSLGSSLSMIASIVFGMIASRWLSKHDYATIRQTFLAYEFAAPLLMLGLPNAVYYFLPREQHSKRGVIVDNMALLVGAGLFFSLFIAFGGHQLLARRFDNPDLRNTLPWLFPYPLLVMPIAGLAAVLVCADRTRTLAVYNVVSSLALTISGIVAVLATESYAVPVLVRIIVPAIFLPVALYLMFTAVPGPLRGPRWASMQEMVRYSVPLGLAAMLGSITLQLHSVIVASMCSPEDFAVYINGAMEIPVIAIVTGSITTVVFAEMAELCAKGDKVAALQLFHKASIKSACVLFPTMCFLLVTAKPFITFLYSEQYHASVVPFVIYLFVLPVRIVVYGAALMALGMSRVILVRSILDLAINSILCYVLVQTIGYIGAAIATMLTLYLWTIPFNLHTIAHGFGIRWQDSIPFKSLLKVLSVCVLCMPLAASGAYIFPMISLGRLSLAAVLYWPVVAYLLYRATFFAPPLWLDQLIPFSFRLHR
jgi:O-antigen/teichoic acid export membrane protein